MLQGIWSTISWALGLGLESKDINAARMSLRAAIVFVISIAMLRLGNQRFLGRSTALDVMLGLIYGALMSRAITGNAPLFPTLAAGLVLVILHWILALIAFRSHRFGKFVKGNERVLVQNGEINWDELRKTNISEHDLNEALRNHGKTPDMSNVKSAHLERNGDISVIFCERNKAP
jgi:uncharacterized membrane protein YcaP (DUF421 family)